jgi:RsiW-degrading membrane proteinase PrsW (M82 family)
MILKVFLWGAVITLPVFFVQIGLKNILDQFNISPLAYQLIYWFLVIAFSEEFFKFLVVKMKVVNSPHLDEPLDVMLYMVVVALGFAAVENVLYLLPVSPLPFNQFIDKTIFVDIIRFIGATFLHTLCSAVVGYSLAISFCEIKTRRIALAGGIIVAVLLHGLYDFSIMMVQGNMKIFIPITIILTLAFLVFSGFEKLKKTKSICKIN